jgi:chondroitin 4-sulfotransferase 11
MPLIHRKKLIFVHIPRTGGSNIGKQLGIPKKRENLYGVVGKTVLQHLTAAEIRSRIGKKRFGEYFKFSFVRNPWSRAASEYRWYVNRTKQNPMSFKEWVLSLDKMLKKQPRVESVFIQHNVPQHTFLYKNGRLLVDFVGRFEDIQKDCDRVCKRINMSEVDMQQRPLKPYQEQYDAATKDIIATIYSKDIKFFKYEF